MKAARILEYRKPLVLEDIAVPDIQADEVLVKVAACGMCRSDVLLVDGFFQNYANIPPPVIPGHEITGPQPFSPILLVETLAGGVLVELSYFVLRRVHYTAYSAGRLSKRWPLSRASERRGD